MPAQPVVLFRSTIIRQLRFVSRLKLYHAGAMAALSVPLYQTYAAGAVDPASLGVGITAVGASAVALFGLTRFTQRVVGELSYDPAHHDVIVSTLTFMGSRQSVRVPAEDVLPVPLDGRGRTTHFFQLRLRSSPAKLAKPLLLSARHGQAVNAALLERLLDGTLEHESALELLQRAEDIGTPTPSAPPPSQS